MNKVIITPLAAWWLVDVLAPVCGPHGTTIWHQIESHRISTIAEVQDVLPELTEGYAFTSAFRTPLSAFEGGAAQ